MSSEPGFRAILHGVFSNGVFLTRNAPFVSPSVAVAATVTRETCRAGRAAASSRAGFARGAARALAARGGARRQPSARFSEICWRAQRGCFCSSCTSTLAVLLPAVTTATVEIATASSSAAAVARTRSNLTARPRTSS